ncbi:ATP-binding protein [Streptomyces pathocidini]|uniref:ATP-binding protein n=1 Tax=Streptomyces pathocidini TaxID=1650571 RepID=UPI0033E7DD7B
MASYRDAFRLADPGDIVAVDQCTVFRLPALRTSAAEVRRRVLALLSEWGADGETRDNTELVVSELVTNAVCHTDSESITCELRLSGALLRLRVTDEGRPAAPLRPDPGDTDGEGGRGLLLVEALSHAWGTASAPDGPGHTVWAELPYALAPLARPHTA